MPNANAPPTIPVVAVTGFLGSGKTTLLNRLLADPAFSDSAVIVNEFGEIGLDHLTIAAGRDNIVLLDSGCLCCAMLDSLRETVVDLVQRRGAGSIPPFRRILIETSGLADPAPILHAVRRDPVVAPLLRLSNVVTVIDAVNAADQLRDHREAVEQVALADTLVMSKLDRLDGAPPDGLGEMLAAINPVASIVSALAVRARPEILLERASGVAVSSAPEPTSRYGRHGLRVRSEAFTIPHATDWPGIAGWTEALGRRWGAGLLRVKALLELGRNGGAVLIDGVRGLYDFHRLEGSPDGRRGGRIVIIGRDLDRRLLQDTLRLLAPARACMSEETQ